MKPECREYQAIEYDGTCYDCRPYTLPDEERTYCEYKECRLRKQVIQFDGTCGDCPDYEVSVTKFSCALATCAPRE